MNNKTTKFLFALVTSIFLFAQAFAKKSSAVISVDGSVYKTGMYPKELYKKLGFKPGPAKEQFEKYKQDIETSELSFEFMPVAGGTFKMGSPKDDGNRGDDELLERKVKVSDFWMGKPAELWMINLDKSSEKPKRMFGGCHNQARHLTDDFCMKRRVLRSA